MATAKKAAAKPAAKKKAAPAKAKTLTPAAQIAANNKALGAALAAGNAVAIGKMYTKTAKLMPSGMPVQKGTKAITACWQAFIGMGIKGATLKSQEVDVVGGSTAIEVGAYSLSVDGGTVVDNGKYIVVWKKEGKEWKLHRDIFNTDRAPAAA